MTRIRGMKNYVIAYLKWREDGEIKPADTTLYEACCKELKRIGETLP